jgi:hypothetical protein
VVDRLQTTSFFASITKLAPVSAQTIPQFTLGRRHVRPRLVVIHGEFFEGLLRASFGRAPCRPDGAFE